MRITKVEPILQKKSEEKKLAKSFSLDEDAPLTGPYIHHLSPFQTLHEAPHQTSNHTHEIDFFCNCTKEILQTKLNCLKREGFESTQFSVVLNLKKLTEAVAFEVRYFDTAKMEIQLEMQGSDQALKELLIHLPKLYQEIAMAVFPYELQLLLPQSQLKLLPPSVSIKDLCKQHRTVYGVNEDEQAP